MKRIPVSQLFAEAEAIIGKRVINKSCPDVYHETSKKINLYGTAIQFYYNEYHDYVKFVSVMLNDPSVVTIELSE